MPDLTQEVPQPGAARVGVENHDPPKRPGIAAGLLIAAITGLGWWGLLGNRALVATLFRPSPDPGPASLILLMLICLSLGSLVMIALPLLRRARRADLDLGIDLDGTPVLKALAFWAVVLVACLLIRPLGFVSVGIGLAVVWLLAFERATLRGPVSIVVALAVGAAITLGVWMVFVRLLGVPLP